jgi:hypothetical protein
LGYEPWPQILNEPKSLYQSPSGTSGFDSIQGTELIEIGDADCPVAHPVDQMLADTLWKIVPTLDLGHQPLKTIRPNLSPRRLASSESVALRKRSEFENESEDRNGDASFRTATMRVFKTSTGIKNSELGLCDFRRTCGSETVYPSNCLTKGFTPTIPNPAVTALPSTNRALADALPHAGEK